jgi:DNA-binding HxlR family transcriptional regulator
MAKAKPRRSPCPVACTLDVLGDKWTMVIVRDLLRGACKFSDFLKSPEHITTNILTNRLKRLELEGIVGKEQYQDNPPRFEYMLTRKGRDLAPLMKEMVKWANAYRSEVILGKV